ncbi:MAG: hypothetical protein AAF998_11035 [Bacteroidota bacterium]
MNLQQNWFPIVFRGDAIPLWQTGRANDHNAPTHRTLPNWTENGKQYFWPPAGQTLPEGGTLQKLSPHLIPQLTAEIVRWALLQLPHPGLERDEDEIIFPHQGSTLRLAVIPPAPHNTEFCLSIRPEDPPPAAKEAYRQVHDAFAVLAQSPFTNGAGTEFTLESERVEVEYPSFARPRLYFQPSGIGNTNDKWKGILNKGPFSKAHFRHRELHCLVIAGARDEGVTKRALGELERGLPSVDHTSEFQSPFPKGWAELFRFKSWTPYYLWLRGPAEWENLEQQVQEAVQAQCREGREGFDLAWIMPPRAHRNAPQLIAGATATLLEFGIPAQVWDLDPFRPGAPPGSAGQRLRELALKSYVKVGGIPWLLPSDRSSDRLVVIGVGSTELTEGVAGFCTIFERDGTFRLGNASAQPSFRDWLRDLSGFVRAQVRKLADQDNWQAGDRVELVFHLPGPEYFGQVGALREQLTGVTLAQYQVSMSFLGIDYAHRDRLWDLERRGRGAESRAAYIPKIGQASIGGEEAWLQLRGIEHERAEDPPLRILLHPDSENLDLTEFTHQIFRFAALSWRTYGLEDLPATLAYGNALTDLLYRIHQAGRSTEVARALHNFPHLKTWFL